ncbi:MAG: Bcr/CflA family drug resistance efflux transporter [Cereibacter sphaeroides]|uniref:Bcr/CflA family efflux transporter n=1 Tax=Cereibacter sphaeroides TaxID=1063 RepID=A0A2W5SKD7_CERSP|nr:MAG: Bcr/CflA family drug resistance efflux transporter [Cereibacter sphaeroides]
MSASLVRPALVLGLLSVVGPFAIDMYLPAMPEIATDLGASVQAMQGTITSYFIAFGLAQLVYGPWADEAGRKKPIYYGVGIFLIGTLICALSRSVEMLMVGRFVQGLGGAAVMVIPRAIIRDMHTGNAATRMMAAIMLVISISPMLAPLAGSGVIAISDWRWIFGILAVAAAASLLLTRFALEETLKPEDRQPVSIRLLLSHAKALLRDPKFMGLTFLGGFGMASFFVFIASASFVYTEEFGLTPTQFSLAFALNALGFFTASQMAAGMGMRYGARSVVAWATAGFAISTVVLLAVGLMGMATLTVTLAGLFLANACLGFVIPTVMVMALDDHGEVAGLASSLGGTLQMLAGGLMIALSGPFFDGTVVPMLASIAVCGVLAFVLSRLVLGRQAVAA